MKYLLRRIYFGASRLLENLSNTLVALTVVNPCRYWHFKADHGIFFEDLHF